jgi:Asp-tRNA(Asn)/Glu-tRNA(Gln) amidotransferase A subunit family amidase
VAPARPLHELGVVQALRAIEDGSTSSEAIVRACLERIAQRDGVVRAFTALDEDAAIAAARAADRGRGGLLRGLPFAAKDVLDTAGLPTAYGSPIYRGHRPAADAACVSLALEQGAVLVGKVATSEFATQTPGPTRNPLDPQRTPGGSSSGSAAAVADGMVPAAFGTQTTGSIVRPASYCGVVGIKPTHGFFADAGLKPLSPTQDTIGVLTRRVEDAAYFAFGVHGSRCVLERHTGALRVGICFSEQWRHLSDEAVAVIDAVATSAERGGLHVGTLHLPQRLERAIAIQPRLLAFEARQCLAHERRHASEQLSGRLRERLAQGAEIDVGEYLRLRAEVEAARALAATLFADHDVLLYPAADGEAEAGLENSGSPRFGALWSLLHLPTVTLPAGQGAAGLPIGVQLVGPFGRDLALLQAAHEVAALHAA